MSPRVLPGPVMTERQFQAWVLEVAELGRWSHFHPYDSRRSRAGWPDLALWRPGEFLVAELKTDTGRVSPAQLDVLVGLEQAGVEVHVWRPCDRGVIEKRLTARRRV